VQNYDASAKKQHPNPLLQPTPNCVTLLRPAQQQNLGETIQMPVPLGEFSLVLNVAHESSTKTTWHQKIPCVTLLQPRNRKSIN